MPYMFTDTKLNKHFNSNNEDLFINRLLVLAKKGNDFHDIEITNSPIMDDCKEYALEAIQNHINKRAGKVYIANNLLHMDRLKVGRTRKEIHERENSLNTAGVVGEVKILYWVNSLDAVMAETMSHQAMKYSRVEGEFFMVDLDTATKTIVECAVSTTTFYVALQEHISMI